MENRVSRDSTEVERLPSDSNSNHPIQKSSFVALRIARTWKLPDAMEQTPLQAIAGRSFLEAGQLVP